MRVLGVDPGLTRCGLGVVDGKPGRATMIAVGVVRTPSDADPGERLVFLERELEGWLDRFVPVEGLVLEALLRRDVGLAVQERGQERREGRLQG